MNENKKTTLSGEPADGVTWGAPQPVDPATGMHKDYWVLSEEERAKGFIRPVRQTYIHVGEQPKYPLRDLTPEEHERGDLFGYVKYEEYPKTDESCLVGRFWTQRQIDANKCQCATRMNRAIAETYARDPKFYGATFCCQCGQHFPVAEFVWEDGTKVGT